MQDNDTEKTFILTDSCMWEANKQLNGRAVHAVEVIDNLTGQTRFIKSGSRIKFLEGEITEPFTQEEYNQQNPV